MRIYNSYCWNCIFFKLESLLGAERFSNHLSCAKTFSVNSLKHAFISASMIFRECQHFKQFGGFPFNLLIWLILSHKLTKFISRSNHPKGFFIAATPLMSPVVNRKHFILQIGTQVFVCDLTFLYISGKNYIKLTKLLHSTFFKWKSSRKK